MLGSQRHTSVDVLRIVKSCIEQKLCCASSKVCSAYTPGVIFGAALGDGELDVHDQGNVQCSCASVKCSQAC